MDGGRQAGFGDTTDYDGGGIVLEGTIVDFYSMTSPLNFQFHFTRRS